MGAKETQIRFKMQKDGEPDWDQTTIDRLWVATQREAMIESGPPPETATTPQSSGCIRAASAEGADEKVDDVATKQKLERVDYEKTLFPHAVTWS